MIKPSLTKFSAAYRGPTDTEDYINLVNEIIHDIRYLMFYMDQNDNTGFPGSSKYITDNMSAIMEGLIIDKDLLMSVPSTPVLYNNGSIMGMFSIQGLNLNEVNQSPSIKHGLNKIGDGLRYLNTNT